MKWLWRCTVELRCSSGSLYSLEGRSMPLHDYVHRDCRAAAPNFGDKMGLNKWSLTFLPSYGDIKPHGLRHARAMREKISSLDSMLPTGAS
jgi:hypothetical protein